MELSRRVVYDAPGEPGDYDPFAVADLSLSKACTETLEFHYPGHFWEVMADHAQGIVLVSIPILTKKYKYVVKIRALVSDPSQRAIVRAGGEILERFKIPRSSLDLSAFMAARNKVGYGDAKPPE